MTFSAPIIAPMSPRAHRVGDRAGGDDRALAGHQARDRGDGAQPARVGERDVRPHEVVGGERVRARLLHERVVGLQKAVERQAPGVADDGDHQRARAVLLLHVHRQAQVHLAVLDPVRLAIDLGEVVAHHRHVVGRARDRVGDQVREGHLALGRLQLAPARVEHGDGERAEARGRGYRPRLLHVAGERRGAALQQLGARPGSCRGLAVGGVGQAPGTVAGGGGQHVGLGDAPRRTAAGDARKVHALCRRRACGHRGDLPSVREPERSAGASPAGAGACLLRR